jgi:hypothetical protein
MGGQRLTLGSDSHRPSQVGLGLDVAIQAAQAAGLSHVAQYVGRQARLVPLESLAPV